RNVVNNDRKVGRLRHGLEMLVKALLGRLVVVRGYGKNSLHAQAAHLGGKIDYFPGVISADSRNHGDSPRHFLDHGADDGEVLSVLERRGFPRCTAGDKEVDAGAELELNQTPQCIKVQGAILPEGGHQRRAATTNVNAHKASTGDWVLGAGGWGRVGPSASLQNVCEVEETFPADDPARRVQGAFSESLATAGRVPQDNCIRLGVQAQLVRAGKVTRAHAGHGNLAAFELGLNLAFDFERRAGGRVFLELVMSFDQVRVVHREGGKGFRRGAGQPVEQIHANGKIRGVNHADVCAFDDPPHILQPEM